MGKGACHFLSTILNMFVTFLPIPRVIGQFGDGQFGTGQFGTRTIWHQYNKTDNPKRSGNKYDDDRASFILV